jgi:hypothetical protein
VAGAFAAADALAALFSTGAGFDVLESHSSGKVRCSECNV